MKPKRLKVTKSNPKPKTNANKTPEKPRTTRIDSYLSQLKLDTKPLLGKIRYLVTDSYYAKTKFVNGVREHGLHWVSKLRHDADLRWLQNGEQKAKGRPRLNVTSIASWKTRRFNAHLLERLYCHLALDFTAIKSSPAFAALCNYGAVAA